MIGVVFGILGFVGLAAAVVNPPLQLLGLAAAVISFFVAGSALSNAAQIADHLQTLAGKSVQIAVGGRPLETGVTFQVRSVRVIGAGLHIYLGSAATERPKDLKIAQPKDANLSDGQLTIAKAAYISFAGVKLHGGREPPALRMSWPAA
jgi:hypothetical protein